MIANEHEHRRALEEREYLQQWRQRLETEVAAQPAKRLTKVGVLKMLARIDEEIAEYAANR